jgi:hypothetical protein
LHLAAGETLGETKKGGSPVNENNRFSSRRNRTLLGVAVVAISLAVAVALVGFSFAAGTSRTAAFSPAKAQYGPNKITICHHTQSLKNPVRTIRIPVSAWKAHKKHGDTMGPCTAQQIKKAKAIAHKKLLKLRAKQKKHVKVVVVVVHTKHGK